MDRERARKYIEQHEERRYLAYPDSKGIMTVGIGFNLEEPSARARIEALNVDYDALCAMRCTLSDAQIDHLFDEDYNSALREAALIVPDFWNHPEDVQLAMVDMRFNMGGPRLAKFVNLIAALEDKDYMRAADAILDSKYAQQDVPERAADNIALVRGSAT